MGRPPSYVQGAYDRDNRFYLDWDPISRDEAAVQAWLRDWVYGLDGRAAYVEKLGAGADRLAPAERERPVRLGRLRAVPVSATRGRPGPFSKSEMMIVAAARELAGQHVCFVGVGLPNIAVNLAKRTVAPDLELVYEAGVFGAEPARLPLSIGDPTIVTGATAVTSMFELFSFYLQGGLIDVGFLGAAQIDRFGNINTTVIGDYDHPTTRLPGSGGACEIAINARQVFVIMRQSKRSFVETDRLPDEPGQPRRGRERRPHPARAGLARDAARSVVVTDLGIYHFDDDGEMRLDSLHPGATLEPSARRSAGSRGSPRTWRPRRSRPPRSSRLIRVELDPEGAYTK